jgi:hypothetical protein
MNQQQQIEIIQAHMAGKRVLMRPSTDATHDGGWIPLCRGEYKFDFRTCHYKVESRKLELFMALPSGVFQALGREPVAASNVWVGNEPPRQLQPGYVIVKIHCTEPEN